MSYIKLPLFCLAQFLFFAIYSISFNPLSAAPSTTEIADQQTDALLKQGQFKSTTPIEIKQKDFQTIDKQIPQNPPKSRDWRDHRRTTINNFYDGPYRYPNNYPAPAPYPYPYYGYPNYGYPNAQQNPYPPDSTYYDQTTPRTPPNYWDGPVDNTRPSSSYGPPR